MLLLPSVVQAVQSRGGVVTPALDRDGVGLWLQPLGVDGGTRGPIRQCLGKHLPGDAAICDCRAIVVRRLCVGSLAADPTVERPPGRRVALRALRGPRLGRGLLPCGIGEERRTARLRKCGSRVPRAPRREHGRRFGPLLGHQPTDGSAPTGGVAAASPGRAEAPAGTLRYLWIRPSCHAGPLPRVRCLRSVPLRVYAPQRGEFATSLFRGGTPTRFSFVSALAIGLWPFRPAGAGDANEEVRMQNAE